MSITPKSREALGYQNVFYIAVSGDYDSSYMLQTSMESQNFTLIDSEVAEMSTLTGTEVDNYLYVFTQSISTE